MIESLLQSEPFELQELLEFKQLLDIPEKPKELTSVLANVLRCGAVSNFEGFPYDKIRRFEPLCTTIKRAIELAPADYRLCFEPSGAGFKKSVQGLLTKAPLYCLMFFSLEGAAGSSLRRLQQAGLAMWESPYLSDAEWRRRVLYQYQLSLRTILESRLGMEWLSGKSSAELCSLRAVRAWFVDMESGICHYARYGEAIELRERRLGLELSKQARKAILAIDSALGTKPEGRPRQRDVKKLSRRRPWSIRGPQNLGGNTWMDCYVPAVGDHFNAEASIYRVRQRPEDAAQLHELDILDIDPGELESPDEFLLSESDTLPFYANEFKNKVRLRGMAQRIETHNQFLPFSLKQFTQRELKELFEALDDVSTDKKFWAEKLLLAAMFATSSWFDRVQNLQILGGEQQLVRGELEILYFNPLALTWLIPAISPEYRTPTDLQAEASSRTVTCDFMELPDLFGFGDLVQRLNVGISRATPFQDKRKLKTRTKRFLKSISPRHTLERLECALLHRAAGKFSPVEASYLFGNPINSASSRMFYTSLSLEHYRKLYEEVCQDMHGILDRHCSSPVLADLNKGSFVGARYCPTSKALKNVFEFMSIKVDALRKDLGLRAETWVELHNWYTVFCSVVQAALIGARGIIEPLLSPSKISPEGVAVFRDKDGVDQFHTRSIQLHPMALEVTRLYQAHRRRTLIRLVLINPKSQSNLNRAQAPWSFFLDHQGNWEEVRPSSIRPYLAQASPLPFNSFRKYLRTRMTELDASPQAIDALLGHASYGEQVWGHFSSLDWSALCHQQKQALDKIIDEVGIELRPGLPS